MIGDGRPLAQLEATAFENGLPMCAFVPSCGMISSIDGKLPSSSSTGGAVRWDHEQAICGLS